MSRYALLLCSIAILGGAAWLNWFWLEKSLDISPIASKAPAASANRSPDGTDSDFAVEVGESLTRPLFHADRRPFVPPTLEPVEAPVDTEIPVEQQPLQPPSALEFRIAGISVFGGEKHALLGRSGTDDLRWFAQGDDVDGWVIASITSETVTLAADDQSFLLSLYPNALPEETN
jgi:hypothetical protein